MWLIAIAGQSWLAAAIPMDSPCCSCKLTHVVFSPPAQSQSQPVLWSVGPAPPSHTWCIGADGGRRCGLSISVASRALQLQRASLRLVADCSFLIPTAKPLSVPLAAHNLLQPRQIAPIGKRIGETHATRSKSRRPRRRPRNGCASSTLKSGRGSRGGIRHRRCAAAQLPPLYTQRGHSAHDHIALAHDRPCSRAQPWHTIRQVILRCCSTGRGRIRRRQSGHGLRGGGGLSGRGEPWRLDPRIRPWAEDSHRG